MLQVDENGIAGPISIAAHTTARGVAEQCCASLGGFTASTLTVSSVEVLAVNERHLARVDLLESWSDGEARLSGSAEAPDAQSAVAAATLHAVAPNGDLIAAGLSRLCSRDAALAAILFRAGAERFVTGPPRTIESLRTLQEGWRSVGLLSVGFEGASHRVIRTKVITLVLTVSERPAAAAEADRWLDVVWRALKAPKL